MPAQSKSDFECIIFTAVTRFFDIICFPGDLENFLHLDVDSSESFSVDW